MSNPTIDALLNSILAKAGAIQLDADSKEHTLDWKKVHNWARDINVLVLEIQERLGLANKDELLLSLTMMLDEHPEKWDGPCLCKSCLEAAS